MNPLRKTIVGGAIVASTLAGGALGAALVNGAAVAQESTSTTTADSSTSTPAPTTAPTPSTDPATGGHVGRNGVTETLLTGDQAEKVKAAALKAVPGGTIQRVENDAEGDTYEAHMLDANGNPVTVKLDSSFNVVRTEAGGPGGAGCRHGGADQDQDATTSSSAAA